MEISRKQKEFLELMEDPQNTELLYGGAAGGASVYGQEVKTPYGAKPIEAINIGDRICNSNGGVSQVIDIPFDGEAQCYGVTFDDDSYTEVSWNHLWKYRIAGRKRNWGQRVGVEKFALGTTEQILEKMRHNNILIPLPKPVRVTRNCSSKKIPAYLMGVLLGDGSFCSGMITLCNPEKEIIDRCKELVSGNIVSYDNGIHWGLPKCTVERRYLEKVGLWGLHSWEKFIPDDYKYASVEDRKAVLQGVIDTDGYVGAKGGVRFGTTSKQLAIDVQFIARSLGANAKLSQIEGREYTNREGERKQQRRAFFEVYIQHEHKEWFVSTTRKLEKIAQNKGNFCNCKRIVSIKPIGIKKCKCISISATDGLYLTNDFIPTHNSKSYSIGLFIVTWAARFPGIRFFVGRKTLKSLRQSTIATLIGKVFPAMGVTPDDYHMSWQNMELTFENGSIVIFGELEYLPSDPTYSRLGSLEVDVAIIDEAGEISRTAKDAIRSRVGRGVLTSKFGMPGKLILASNPDTGWLKTEYYDPFVKLGGHSFERWKIGTVTLNEGQANEAKVPAYRAFLRATVYDNPFLPQSYVDNLKSLPDVLRKKLLDGNWDYADEDDTLFKSGLLDKATVYDLPSKSEKFSKFIGVDLADKGKDRSVYTLIDNGIVVAQKVSQVKTDWTNHSDQPLSLLVADELIEFAQRNGFTPKDARRIAVETNGIGVGVRDTLKMRGWYITEYTATHKSRSENYYQLMLDMDSGGLKIYHEMYGLDELRKELAGHTYTMQNQIPSVCKKDDIKLRIGRSPDLADSLCIANYARNLVTNPALNPKLNRSRIIF